MKIFIIAICYIFFTSGSIYADAPQEVVLGVIKHVNCKDGEVTLTTRSGDVLFYIAKDAAYNTAKGCEDIKEGYIAVLKYKNEDGKKTASLIKIKIPGEVKK